MKLIPCPFCGGKAKISQRNSWYQVACDHTEPCPLHGCPSSPYWETKQALEQSWNMRYVPKSEFFTVRPLIGAKIFVPANACGHRPPLIGFRATVFGYNQCDRDSVEVVNNSTHKHWVADWTKCKLIK